MTFKCSQGGFGWANKESRKGKCFGFKNPQWTFFFFFFLRIWGKKNLKKTLGPSPGWPFTYLERINFSNKKKNKTLFYLFGWRSIGQKQFFEFLRDFFLVFSSRWGPLKNAEDVFECIFCSNNPCIIWGGPNSNKTN